MQKDNTFRTYKSRHAFAKLDGTISASTKDLDKTGMGITMSKQYHTFEPGGFIELFSLAIHPDRPWVKGSLSGSKVDEACSCPLTSFSCLHEVLVTNTFTFTGIT